MRESQLLKSILEEQGSTLHPQQGQEMRKGAVQCEWK